MLFDLDLVDGDGDDRSGDLLLDDDDDGLDLDGGDDNSDLLDDDDLSGDLGVLVGHHRRDRLGNGLR